MNRLATAVLLGFTTFSLAAEADPAKLRPSQEELAKAEVLVKKLGSDAFAERDQASRELAEMGRLALAVIDRTLAETASAEVRARCEALRPAMLQEDLKARLDAFIADADGKFDHKLPGWDKFKKTAGNTADTRKLFGEMFEHTATARLLTASLGPKEDFHRLVLDRRIEIYNRIYGRSRFVAGNGMIIQEQRQPPTVPEVAGLLFAEAAAGTIAERRYAYVMSTMLNQAPIRETLLDETKGAALRKLFIHWCDTRTEPIEQYSAMNLVAQLNIKGTSAVDLAKKVLQGKGITPFYRAASICMLAKAGGKDQLSEISKHFDDKTVFTTAAVNVNGVVERTEVQIRDIALAMAVIVTDQKFEDYGIVARNPAETMKFSYSNYRFPSDDKRNDASKKWDEYLKKK